MMHFELGFVQDDRQDLVPLFCMWIFSFPTIVFQKAAIFLMFIFVSLSKLGHCSCLALCLLFLLYLTCLCVCFLCQYRVFCTARSELLLDQVL